MKDRVNDEKVKISKINLNVNFSFFTLLFINRGKDWNRMKDRKPWMESSLVGFLIFHLRFLSFHPFYHEKDDSHRFIR